MHLHDFCEHYYSFHNNYSEAREKKVGHIFN